MRRLAAVLLALVAVFGVSVSGPQPARADGIIGEGINGACRFATGPVLGVIMGGHPAGNAVSGPGSLTGMGTLCNKVGQVGEAKIKAAWKKVWDSVLGDVVNSAADVVRWVIKTVLTVALLGPSVDLRGTGLWDGKATLAGMLTWLGLVIATLGMMWQLGKMAVTGQMKHAGRAILGWGENMLLSTFGVGMFAILLTAGDAMTTGLVNATFDNNNRAYETIVAVLVPSGVSNPITMLCVVSVLLLIGFIQLILIYLRQSAIPLICLLLPVAGGGRAGGDTTRKWAPRLVTSGLVIVAYKPMLAIIICTGFAEFGHSKTVAEWLRGCATLVLAILAPGPLTKIFAPFGEAAGSGMASGGMSGALSSAAGFFLRRGRDDDGGSGGGPQPKTAVEHSQYVAKTMSSQKGRGGDEGEGREGNGDAQTQAARNEANKPSQGAMPPAANTGTPGKATNTAGTAAAGGVGVGVGIEILDGVNNGIQGASGTMGNGGNQQ